MLEIFIDGACSGNPGLASIGVVIKKDNQIVKEIARLIGNATNNIAEYSAFIAALEEALSLKENQIKVYTDSQLLYNQLRGTYKVKNDQLKDLWQKATDLAKKFKAVEIVNVRREENKEADKLASGLLQKTLKEEQAKAVAPTFRFTSQCGEESPSSEG